jgi:hypothetical protein
VDRIRVGNRVRGVDADGSDRNAQRHWIVRANGLTLSEAQQTVVDAYGDNVQVPAVGMVLCFLVAISLTIGAGFFL